MRGRGHRATAKTSGFHTSRSGGRAAQRRHRAARTGTRTGAWSGPGHRDCPAQHGGTSCAVFGNDPDLDARWHDRTTATALLHTLATHLEHAAIHAPDLPRAQDTFDLRDTLTHLAELVEHHQIPPCVAGNAITTLALLTTDATTGRIPPHLATTARTQLTTWITHHAPPSGAPTP